MIPLRISGFGLVIVLALPLFFFAYSAQEKDALPKADLVVFSYDRPLQLYAFLESAQRCLTGVGQIQVIYRASSPEFANAYQEVKAAFSYVTFLIQGDKPKEDFKPLTLKATFSTPNDHVLFAVDDIIIKDHIAVDECIAALEETQAYAFYLRMGRNLTECYTLQCAQSLPLMREVKPGIYVWCFAQGQSDWRYPHSVDMTLYRKKDIRKSFESLQYTSPNVLEANWAGLGLHILHKHGLCYEQSKIVNLPLNRVQDFYNNRFMEGFPANGLLAIFNQKQKIDINPLHKIDNKSAHMEYVPTFVERN